MIGNGQNSVQRRPWEPVRDCIGSILKVKAAVYVSYDTPFIKAGSPPVNKLFVRKIDLAFGMHACMLSCFNPV